MLKLGGSLRDRSDHNMTDNAVFNALYSGEYVPGIETGLLMKLAGEDEKTGIHAGYYIGKRITGLYCVDISLDGMFLLRDKIPLIAWIKHADNRLLPFATVVLEGYSYKQLTESDERGLIADYFTPDTYANALIISRNNIVYRLINRIELEPYIYDFIIQKATKAPATFRQLHRKFD